MQLKSALVAALLGVSSVVEASTIPSRGLAAREPQGFGNFGNNFKGGKGGNTGTNTNTGNNANAGSNTNNAAAASSSAAAASSATNNKGGAAATLDANAVQTGSAQSGQAGNAVEAGQVASLTDNANFINFCAGKTLTNGIQVTGGSCNGVVMGQLPAKTAMVSSILTFPAANDNIAANQQFNVSLKIQNIQTGFFTNAQTTYYSAPQQLNQQGLVIGHTHVTIQDLGNSLNPAKPLDASQFVFFKGINNAADANGALSATVTGGLPAGNYRVCTMAGAANHQPVLMPVAQRGAQDDCNKFTVTANGGNANANGGKANAGAANAGAANGGAANAGTATANAGAAASSSAANTGKTGKTGANAGTGKNGKSGSNNSNTNSGTSNANQSNGNQNANTATAATSTTASAAASAAASTTASTTASTAASASAGASAAGAIGGIAAPAVTNSGDSTRPFSVNGNTFVNKAAAVQRACSIQNNACADAVNSGSVKGSTVADCNKQETTCNSQAA